MPYTSSTLRAGLLLALGVSGASLAHAIILPGHVADNMAYSTAVGDGGTSVSGSGVSAAVIRFGRGGTGLHSVSVFVFQLPDLGPNGVFTAASFTINVVTGNNTPPVAGHLDGLGSRSTSTVVMGDYFSGPAPDPTDATRIMTNFIPNTGNVANGATFSVSGTALVDYLNAQYASGAGVGRFVLLRISGNGWTDASSLEFASADNANAALRPSIDYSFTVIPEPGAAAGLAGVAALGAVALRRRRRD
jgi:hypothetical protein